MSQCKIFGVLYESENHIPYYIFIAVHVIKLDGSKFTDAYIYSHANIL